MYRNSILRGISLMLVFSMALLLLNAYVAGAQSVNASKLSIKVGGEPIYLNDSLAIPFNVTLTSGTAGTTYLIVGNGAALQSKGIYVGLNPSSGVPPFNGILYINTNVAPGVVPGTYTLNIESGGADPIYPGTFNFTLTVLNTVKPTTTVSATQQTTSYPVTSAPTTTISQNSGQPSGLLGIGAGVIIVILIVLLIIYMVVRPKSRK